MIIPPDPEKDPRLFDPSASTPSLIQLPSEFDDTTSRWDGDSLSESLPPYERRRNSRESLISNEIDNNDIFSNQASISNRNLPGIITNNLPTQPQLIHQRQRHSPSSPISSSSSLTPTLSRQSLSLPHFNHHQPQSSSSSTLNHASGSTSKLWENSSSSLTSKSGLGSKSKRRCTCLPLPPVKLQRWWKKYKRYIQGLLILFFIGIGLTVGLLVGINKKQSTNPPIAPWQKPWMDQDTDGKRVAAWAGYGSFNLTYSDTRDGPPSSEGNLTECNIFTPLNLTSSPFTNLFTPFPDSTSSLASFTFPFSSSGTPPSDLFINARGFGSSGTLRFLGKDGPEAVMMSGEEGKILIDVVVRYSGDQDLNTMMRVCKMTRGDAGVGVGIYSPRETDGKLTNPFKLNPNLIPTNLIIIRLPPSVYSDDTPPINLPSFSIDAEHLVVHLGKLDNVVSFDTLNLDTNRGGVQVGHAQAKKASVVAFEGTVNGVWNVSESLIVNVTDGSITSDIILSDPNNSTDNTTTLPPISDYTVFRRTPFPSPTTSTEESEDDFEQEVHSLFNSTSTESGKTSIKQPNGINNQTKSIIITNLFTTSGYINLRYLHQPTTIDLSAIIGTQQGNLNIKFNPNYIGPFISRTHWGQINILKPLPISELAPPSTSSSSSSSITNLNINPNSNSEEKPKTKIRNILISPLSIIQPNSTFSILGYTQDKLKSSCDTISGFAYWSETKWNGNRIINQTMDQLQNDTISGINNNNQVLVLGDWGDIDISFDGQ